MIDTTISPAPGQNNLHKHYRRVRWSANAVFSLLSIFVTVSLVWAPLRLLTCGAASTDSARNICETAYLWPIGIAVLAFFAFMLIVIFLKIFGLELEKRGEIKKIEGNNKIMCSVHHVKHAYHLGLDQKHKKRVRWSLHALVIMISAILGFFTFYVFFYDGLPFFVSLIVGIIPFLASIFVDRRYL